MEVVAHDHIGGALGERKRFHGDTGFQDDPHPQTRLLRQGEKDSFKGKELLPQVRVFSELFIVDFDSVKAVFFGQGNKLPGVTLCLMGRQNASEDFGVLLDCFFSLGHIVDNG